MKPERPVPPGPLDYRFGYDEKIDRGIHMETDIDEVTGGLRVGQGGVGIEKK